MKEKIVRIGLNETDKIVYSNGGKRDHDPKWHMFTVKLWKEDEGGYSVQCVELPGCISQGETKQETIDNIIEAIRLRMFD